MDFFGINGSELLLILIVGVIVVGPKNAAQAIVWLKSALQKLREWSQTLRQEANLTKDGQKIDLKDFDPRNYDPRKLIKDAVAEEMKLWLEASAPIEDSAKSLAKDLEDLPESLKLFEPQLKALEEKKAAEEKSPTREDGPRDDASDTDAKQD